MVVVELVRAAAQHAGGGEGADGEVLGNRGTGDFGHVLAQEWEQAGAGRTFGRGGAGGIDNGGGEIDQ